MELRRSAAPEQVVVRTGGNTMWAPHLEMVGSRWCLYYSVEQGSLPRRTHVAESAGSDPTMIPGPSGEPTPATVRIRDRHSGLCLDDYIFGTAPGSEVRQWTCDGDNARQRTVS